MSKRLIINYNRFNRRIIDNVCEECVIFEPTTPTPTPTTPTPTINPCICDSYNRFLCTEKVDGYYNVTWTEGGNASPMTSELVPSEQPYGTLYVVGDTFGGCVGTSGIFQDHINYPGTACYNSSEPFRETGAAAARSQWYYRYRVVDDCSECVTTDPIIGPGECETGTTTVSCVPFTQQLCEGYSQCLEETGVDPCYNTTPTYTTPTPTYTTPTPTPTPEP
jgi:hypothetical protein